MRADSNSSAIIGSGSTKLSTTWLATIARVTSQPAATTANAGTTVTARRTQTGMRRWMKPCITTCPAIVPTTELDTPDVSSATARRPPAEHRDQRVIRVADVGHARRARVKRRRRHHHHREIHEPGQPERDDDSRFERTSRRRSASSRGAVRSCVRPECRYSVCGMIVAPMIPTAIVSAA